VPIVQTIHEAVELGVEVQGGDIGRFEEASVEFFSQSRGGHLGQSQPFGLRLDEVFVHLAQPLLEVHAYIMNFQATFVALDRGLCVPDDIRKGVGVCLAKHDVLKCHHHVVQVDLETLQTWPGIINLIHVREIKSSGVTSPAAALVQGRVAQGGGKQRHSE